MDHDHSERGHPPGFWGTRYAIGFLVIGAIAGYFLLTEHLAHVVGALPLLFLLACPLMHIFMHHGHGGHDHQHADHSPTVAPPKSPEARTGESP